MTSTEFAQTAAVIANRDDRPAKWFFGGQTWLHASAETTGGAFGLLEQIADPGVGSPYHIHHNEDEAFYVIEGSLRVVVDGKESVAGPGTWAFLPKGVPHGFEAVGEGPSRFLILASPAGFERFITEQWEDAPAPPDMAKVMELACRYGIEILGPLPE